MGDAVLRVRGQLQSLARENWAALEERHARNVSRLRDELAQISRSLEIKARFEHSLPVASAPFPSDQENAAEAAGPSRKKQKIEETQREDAALVTDTHEDERPRTRLSMRLRSRSESVDIVEAAGGLQKRTRKRGRPSDAILRDPGKLKVVDLRSELKKRGLRTSGLKAVLMDRLLDALEEEQKEDRGHLKKVAEAPEGTKEIEVIVIDDAEDEIVRESVGSNKSPRSFMRSESMSPKASAEDNEEDEAATAAKESPAKDTGMQWRSSPQPRTNDGEEKQAIRSLRAEETPSTWLEAAENTPEVDSARPEQQQCSSDTNAEGIGHGARLGVELNVTVGAEEVITHDSLQMTRKSMQISGKSKLASPLAWKRKSILRKASSLAPSTQGLTRKVSFASVDKVDVIVESSQTEPSQPDPSPEKDVSAHDGHPPLEENQSSTLVSLPVPDMISNFVTTPVAPSSTPTPAEDPPTRKTLEKETEEQRKRREFDENVQREAKKLRLASQLSAQKLLEEAKASKAFWAKRDQLKAKLRASSAGEKRKSAHTPVPLSDKPIADKISPPTSELSPTTTPSASDTSRITTLGSKDETRTQQAITTPYLDEEEAKDLNFIGSMARQHEVESISDVSSAFESSLYESKAPRPTYSVVEDKNPVERSMSRQTPDIPAAKAMPVIGSSDNYSARLRIEATTEQDLRRSTHESSYSSSPVLDKGRDNAEIPKHPTVQDVEPLFNRDRSDSLSSTVSSIPEPSVVENALKLGASAASNDKRRPISNLVSGVHSFTTLLEKDNSQESNSNRSAPVVNALKLAERSRVAEEKKKLEKERRRAILKKKMEENKKAAALKEKDVQAKRELDRLNERKKREAELARKRQQRLKEMRAGLEKKRAMLAAEKKSGNASSVAISSKSAPIGTASSHVKHRGLANASEASQPTAKPMSKPISKPVQKPVSKPMPKLIAKPAQVPKAVPQSVPKPVSRPAMTPTVPAKHALKSHSPEVVNYEMSDNAESSGGDSSDSDSERTGKKKVPRWAQKDHLNKILHAQFGRNAVDPSPAIFQDFVDTCNLEAIFETTDIRKKKKFARRTSSGNWLADRPTARDRALYQHDMGYNR